jgi:asparagine synthase (glutamine-hydrolysing)
MCGMAGIWNTKAGNSLEAELRLMLQPLEKRGPDAKGIACFQSQAGSVALGHQRLSILDLSESGQQPMENHRYAIVFNGEIYNHQDLRNELRQTWRGHSDTEVLLSAITHWGIGSALGRTVGMFAFALWDKQENKLILARDRLGEKPLFWSQKNGLFFASTSEALARTSHFDRRINPEAEEAYLQLGYVPTELSIWEGVKAVSPGTFLIFSAPNAPPETKIYWDAASVALHGKDHPIATEEEAERLVLEQIEKTLQQQRVADVPVGCFLSSGIDSSLLAALLAKAGPLRTFTASFKEGEDESAGAAAIAKLIGSSHSILELDSKQMLEFVPKLVEIYDEPFGDASAIPTALLCQKMRAEVKVALSGDGADELFAGYNRHLWGPRWNRRMGALPKVFRKPLAPLLRYWPLPGSPPQAQEKREKLIRLLKASNASEVYWTLASQGISDPLPYSPTERRIPHSLSELSAYQLRDQLSYLPGDILVKVDRAAMYWGLESRAPYLDHRLVELSWRIPEQWKIQKDGISKWILKKIWKKELSGLSLSNRKVGFSPPLRQWLLGPLKPWVEETLGPERKSEPRWKWQSRDEWKQLQRGRGDPYRLWTPIMLAAWRRRWGFD